MGMHVSQKSFKWICNFPSAMLLASGSRLVGRQLHSDSTSGCSIQMSAATLNYSEWSSRTQEIWAEKKVRDFKADFRVRHSCDISTRMRSMQYYAHQLHILSNPGTLRVDFFSDPWERKLIRKSQQSCILPRSQNPILIIQVLENRSDFRIRVTDSVSGGVSISCMQMFTFTEIRESFEGVDAKTGSEESSSFVLDILG